MTRDRTLGFVLLAMALSLPAAFAAGGEIDLPSARAEWRSLQTPNFRVVGDASARKLHDIGEALEQFRSSMLWLRAGSTDRAGIPTLVIAFSSQQHFRPYGAVGFDDDDDRIGAFHPTSWGNYMLVDSSAGGENPLSTVYEGYVHFVVRSTYPSAPLWLKVGLAEYFGSFRAGRNGIEVGRPVRYHVREMRDGWRLPLVRLLEVERSDPEYRDDTQERVYRAQCWLLVHYALVGEREMAPRLVELLRRLDAGEPVAKALPAAFGMSQEELESRLLRYAKSPVFRYVTYSAAELQAPEVGEPVGISRAEALALLGEFMAHARAVAPARTHLEAAAELDSSNGDVVALLGYLAELEEDDEAAGELYARAAGLPETRASSAAHGARFALDRASAAAEGSEAARAELEKARRAADRAIELDPDYGEPWALRGLVELRAREPEAAVVTLAEAARRLPDRADVVYNRFLANLQAGQTAVARGIAAGPLRRLDPESAADALRQLDQQASRDRVGGATETSRQSYEAGDPEAAAEALRQALAQTSDPQERQYLEERLAFVERAAVEKRRVEAYNRAVSLANAQKLREAKAELEALLAECGNDTAQVCTVARDTHAQVDKLLARR
ncbi:MAG TPA: hypothetical protein VLA66_05280 [Thermoanaerobaculia bacterium]|nr:hypothetical protein [Thermoanaerobaculia bacterium]